MALDIGKLASLYQLKQMQEGEAFRKWQQEQAYTKAAQDKLKYEQEQQRIFTDEQLAPMISQTLKGTKGNRQEFADIYGQVLKELPMTTAEDFKYGMNSFDEVYNPVDRSGKMGREYPGIDPRNLSPEVAYVVSNFADKYGKAPETQEEFYAALVDAYSSQGWKERRQEFSNIRARDSFQDKGLNVDNPDQKVVFDPKTGTDRVTKAGPTTIDQKLGELTAEQTKALSEYSNLDHEINTIRSSMNDILTGPFQGNWNEVKSKFVNTPEYTAHKAKVDRLRTIIYGLSGKQINETEQKWLDGILPKLYNPDENFEIRLNEIQEWIQDRQAAELIELRNSRRFTGTKPLKEKPKEVAPKKDEPKRIRIKVTN